jgi:hypothetical protein
MSESITKNPWLFACQWYKVDDVHSSITRAGLSTFGEPIPVQKDVSSREFAEFLTDQYRLAMRKGAELAISEMMEAKEVRNEDHLPKLSDLMGLLEHDPIDIGG